MKENIFLVKFQIGRAAAPETKKERNKQRNKQTNGKQKHEEKKT